MPLSLQCDVLIIVSPPAVVQCLRDAEKVTVINVCLSRKELFRRWFELSFVSGEKRMPARMVALYGNDRDDAATQRALYSALTDYVSSFPISLQ